MKKVATETAQPNGALNSSHLMERASSGIPKKTTIVRRLSQDSSAPRMFSISKNDSSTTTSSNSSMSGKVTFSNNHMVFPSGSESRTNLEAQNGLTKQKAHPQPTKVMSTSSMNSNVNLPRSSSNRLEVAGAKSPGQRSLKKGPDGDSQILVPPNPEHRSNQSLLSPANSKSLLAVNQSILPKSEVKSHEPIKRAQSDVTSMFGQNALELKKRSSYTLISLQKKVEALTSKKKNRHGNRSESESKSQSHQKLMDSSFFIKSDHNSKGNGLGLVDNEAEENEKSETKPQDKGSKSGEGANISITIKKINATKDGLNHNQSNHSFDQSLPAAHTIEETSDFSGSISSGSNSKQFSASIRTMQTTDKDDLKARRRSDSVAFFKLRDDSTSAISSMASELSISGCGRLTKKYNSCSTLFIDSSITFNKLKEILMSCAIGIYCNIKYSHEIKCFRSHDIFSEKIKPLSSDYPAQKLRRIPDVTDVFKFLLGIFDATKLNSETAIIFMIYMERMMKNTGVTLYCSNWRRVVLGALILASKVWDDQAIWNIDYNTYFPEVNVKDLNNLERWYLKAIDYNVGVKGILYAQYYFELRDLTSLKCKNWNTGKRITYNMEKMLTTHSTNPSMSINNNNGSNNNGSRSLMHSLDSRKNRSESNLDQMETILSTSDLKM